jgi:hypothetical protein
MTTAEGTEVVTGYFTKPFLHFLSRSGFESLEYVFLNISLRIKVEKKNLNWPRQCVGHSCTVVTDRLGTPLRESKLGHSFVQRKVYSPTLIIAILNSFAPYV